MTVDKDLRLEVLDWGGSGKPLVLLAGGGNTAHVFDEFALKLTADYHVYGITRRGFGASSFQTPENAADRLGEDVLTVIDALKLDRPVLVGHSVAGAELSFIATSHADRVAGLVYLEAGYPYAFDNGKVPSMMEFQGISGPQPSAPSASDWASFSALQAWNEKVLGFRTPEAELRRTWDATPDGRPEKFRASPGSRMLGTIVMSPKKYADIPAPSLVVFAMPHAPESWIGRSTDPAVREAAKVHFTKLDALVQTQARELESSVAAARVIRLRGAHYIFLSNEQEVLREMRKFLAGLK